MENTVGNPDQNKKRFTKEKFEELLTKELFKRDEKGYFRNQAQINAIRQYLGTDASVNLEREEMQKFFIGTLSHFYRYEQLNFTKDESGNLVFIFHDKEAISGNTIKIVVIDVNGLRRQ